MGGMFRRATAHSRYLRFFSNSPVGPELEVHRIEDGRPLVAVVAIDTGDTGDTGDAGVDHIIGLATCDVTGVAGDLAVFVEDGWQGRGLGNRLSRTLMREAMAAGIESVSAHILWDNPASLHMMRRAFPDARVEADHGEYVIGPVRTLRRHGANTMAVKGQAGEPAAA